MYSDSLGLFFYMDCRSIHTLCAGLILHSLYFCANELLLGLVTTFLRVSAPLAPTSQWRGLHVGHVDKAPAVGAREAGKKC